MVSVTRLRRLTRAEAAHRLNSVCRRSAQRAIGRVRPPKWDLTLLAHALAPATLDHRLSPALDAHDWHEVQRALFDRLRQRPSRFLIDHEQAPASRAAILETSPDGASHAAAQADPVLQGRFDLLGYKALSFDDGRGGIDWHLDPVHARRMPASFWADIPYLDPRYGDHKIVWELNRHQHFLRLGRAYWLTGNPVYAHGIVSQLHSWLDGNPPLTGVNWASMLELAFRSQSWLWALHFLLDRPAPIGSGPWLPQLLLGLDAQLTHVERNLSHYFSPNTHLTGEALALYVVGTALPELRASARWIDTGRRILIDELPRQVCPDGGHAERSTHYHRYTLDFYLQAWLTAERSGDSEAAAIFSEAVERMARFMRAMADDRGHVPQIGDDDGGMLWPLTGRNPRDVRDSLSIAAAVLGQPGLAPWGVTEEAHWIAGSARCAALSHVDARGPQRSSTAAIRVESFDDTGYVVIRNDAGDHLVFDAGPHGYLNGGHAHADALSLALVLDGSPLLIDPGTATYTMRPELRDRFRTTASHNTVTLDDRPSSTPSGPFHWTTRANARLGTSRGNARFAWVEAAHDGFTDVEHRRHIVHGAATGWLIVDRLTGRGHHTAEVHWHFDPLWHVQTHPPDRLLAEAADGRKVWMVHDGERVGLGRGNSSGGFGWCSPCYGALVPAWTATATRTRSTPFAIVTWIGSADDRPAPLLEQIEVEGADAGDSTAVRVRHGAHSVVTLVRDTQPSPRHGERQVEGYETDARLLQYSTSHDSLLTLTIADGTCARARRDAFISVASADRIQDLTIELRGETLEMWTSRPDAALTLRGQSLRRIRVILVNGREHRHELAGTDTVMINAADWAAPSERAQVCVG